MNQEQKKITTALKKARTSIESILRKVENADTQQECFDAIQQNLAVIGLLRSVNSLMLEQHIERTMQNTKGVSSRSLKKMKGEIIKALAMAQNK